MGNSCECEGEPIINENRDRLRARSLSEAHSNLNIKNLIQVKYFRISSEYILINPPIGKGSFGSVYKAVHRSSNIFRAVKRIEKRKKSIERLE